MSACNGGVISEVILKVNSSSIGNVEVIKGVLAGLGVGEECIVECKEWPYTRLSVYFNSPAKARALQKKLRAFRLRHVSITLKSLRKRDWQTKWKRAFRPFP